MALSKFPSYQELEQNAWEILDIIEKPIEKWDIVEITWYPGTWKTLVSWLKFTHCTDKNKIYLTFANMLLAYTKQWLWEEENIFVFDEYLYRVWDSGSVYSSYSLNRKRDMRIDNLPFKYWDWKILFLDEAQDIPSDIVAKLSLKFDSIVICWDKDQAIYEHWKDWSDYFQEYENNLQKLDPEFNKKYMFRNPKKLTKNYRNTKPIFDFAKQFQPDAMRINDIEIMREWWDIPQLRIWKDSDMLDELSNLCVNWIRYQQTIWVIVESPNEINYVYEYLKNSLRNKIKDFEEDSIYYYISGDKYHADKVEATEKCVQANIVVSTPYSMKWLEFDVVILWKAWQSDIWKDTSKNRNLFYVSMTRAKDNLIICQNEDGFWDFNIDDSTYIVNNIENSEDIKDTKPQTNNYEDDDLIDLPF